MNYLVTTTYYDIARRTKRILSVDVGVTEIDNSFDHAFGTHDPGTTMECSIWSQEPVFSDIDRCIDSPPLCLFHQLPWFLRRRLENELERMLDAGEINPNEDDYFPEPDPADFS